jgi:hypothetical protein
VPKGSISFSSQIECNTSFEWRNHQFNPFFQKNTGFVLSHSLRFTHKMQLISLHNEVLVESHFQYHLPIRIMFIICKFVIFKPPFDFGLQTRSQFIRCIFLILMSDPLQRKFLLIASIS